ncbi:ABC transporter permease [Priestia endophytica]|uniref:ABC transporter permease n=1 Tax=Priestia endophytica TaxID=135735 RepID=UPI00124D003F|nr:ABC transporter permease [Priestia endophytica]KAB2490427.1 ABC transporter permease [Priestia endophytica]
MNNNKNTAFLHEQYLRTLKREKAYVRLFQLLILVSFFVLWEVGSRTKILDPLIFSSPVKVSELFVEKLMDGSLLQHTSITLFETLLGFLIGTLAGILLASFLWWSPKLAKILDPYLVVLNAMPKVALGPILIVAIGPNFSSILIMGALISVIITTIVIYTAFKEVDPNYVKVLRIFNASRLQCFKEAILPSSFPAIISTFKVNVGLSWVGVIVGEFLVSSQGLGYMIIYGFQVFNFTLVLLSLVLIAILATLMYQGVAILEKKLLK